MTQPVTKAIFPVAGMGTRFLPATKSIPKEILPLIDRPLIQYAIEEAREAGIKEFIFVTSRGKSALENYFDGAPELEKSLEKKGKTKLLEELHKTEMDSGAIAYIRQREALGLGHAVWCARRLIAPGEPFAVVLPDDVIQSAEGEGCLKQMIDAYQNTGGSMVATMEVPMEKISAYGVLDIENDMGHVVKAAGMVEKPIREDAPSNLAVIGRYVLSHNVMDHLNKKEIGAGGEIQLTDAIAKELSEDGVFGLRFKGRRFDCGSKAGYLQATVAFALERDDLREEFSDFLNETIALDKAAE